MAEAAPAVAPAPAKKATKAKKPAVKASHPPFGEMVTVAIKSLKERSGSSRQAILKYIIANFGLGDDKKTNSRLKAALRKGAETGALNQVKGTGASGSFRVAKEEPKPKKVAEKKPAPKKTAEKKPSAKKTAEKKPTAKTTAAKKPAAKKATKKPAAKKPAAKSPAKVAAKKPAAKKPVAKKPAAKTAAKKPAAKTAAKKPAKK